MVGDVDGDGHHDIVDVPPYGIGCPTSTETGARAVVLSTGSGYTGAMAGYWSSLNDYLLPHPTARPEKLSELDISAQMTDGRMNVAITPGGVFLYKPGMLPTDVTNFMFPSGGMKILGEIYGR